ncbi:MAG: Mth938-like domain-containing protein [Candidatus Aminicenantes bacterium]|nr:Mth938-like domain-containing protein [Candidatus Aminicenantes bacterium]
MIESYTFGKIKVKGQTFTSDVIVFPDKIKSPWWRISGHNLCLDDIQSVFQAQPEIFIIGTGFFGLMKVEKDVIQFAESKGIQIFIKKTEEAVKLFNELWTQKQTIGAFHLTC